MPSSVDLRARIRAKHKKISYITIMYIVIAFIFIGMGAGYALRGKNTLWLPKATTLLVWALLLLIGIEVGSDHHIIQALPTLGVEALVVATMGTLGSCSAAWLLGRYINRKGGARK